MTDLIVQCMNIMCVLYNVDGTNPKQPPTRDGAV